MDKKDAYVYDSVKGEDVFRLVNLEPGHGLTSYTAQFRHIPSPQHRLTKP